MVKRRTLKKNKRRGQGGGDLWNKIRSFISGKHAIETDSVETDSVEHYEPHNKQRFQEFKNLLIKNLGDNQVELTKIMQPGAAEKLYKDANYDETDEFYNMIKGALIVKIEHKKLDVKPENLTKLKEKRFH